MKTIQVNSASFCFIGLFPYDSSIVNKTNLYKEFSPLNLYEENKAYFDQKYYSNWVHSIFLGYTSRMNILPHLKLRKSNELFNGYHSIEIDEDHSMKFSIRDVNVFFFEGDLGVFNIKIDLHPDHYNCNDVVRFGHKFRQSTVNNKFRNGNLSIDIIEKYITSKFHEDGEKWRQYNPLLKSAVFLDIKNELNKEEMDKLVYGIGTYSIISNNFDLFDPDPDYFNNLISENGISPFKNWKALCTYDSICRIAINLKEKDMYRLWENEYILIYIYVLYARYFLHHTNNELTKVFQKPRLIEGQRLKFYSFKNEFNHAKISYKFLPNLIYNKLKNTLDIKEELHLVEEKLTNLNVIREENYQNRVNRMLLILTLLTVISVAFDGGEMLKKWNVSEFKTASISILIFCILIMGYLFFVDARKSKL